MPSSVHTTLAFSGARLDSQQSGALDSKSWPTLGALPLTDKILTPVRSNGIRYRAPCDLGTTIESYSSLPHPPPASKPQALAPGEKSLQILLARSTSAWHDLHVWVLQDFGPPTVSHVDDVAPLLRMFK